MSAERFPVAVSGRRSNLSGRSHDYMGHDYIGHNYLGHNCIGSSWRRSNLPGLYESVMAYIVMAYIVMAPIQSPRPVASGPLDATRGSHCHSSSHAIAIIVKSQSQVINVAVAYRRRRPQSFPVLVFFFSSGLMWPSSTGEASMARPC